MSACLSTCLRISSNYEYRPICSKRSSKDMTRRIWPFPLLSKFDTSRFSIDTCKYRTVKHWYKISIFKTRRYRYRGASICIAHPSLSHPYPVVNSALGKRPRSYLLRSVAHARWRQTNQRQGGKQNGATVKSSQANHVAWLDLTVAPFCLPPWRWLVWRHRACATERSR